MLIPVCLLLLPLGTLYAFLLTELWINCSYSCNSSCCLMHLISAPSFCSPQCSCHLLELIELNSNTNIQFAILEAGNVTCSAWRSSSCGKVWMWYIFNRIHRFETSSTWEVFSIPRSASVVRVSLWGVHMLFFPQRLHVSGCKKLDNTIFKESLGKHIQ